jgi:putative oxygen-independent coproporphyrinogen III oxidase
MQGLYVHIPFCVKKCAYCDFYSLPQRLDSVSPYINALLTESKNYSGLDFQTLYLGGGTPSLLGAQGLSKLLDGLRGVFALSTLSEATMEANPESLTTELLEAAQGRGINRLSIGVQSLSDRELASVGRIHSAHQAIQAVELARASGFANISADVILGLPGQDCQSLMVTLETLIGLDIQHISAYCLAVEPHTPLAANPPADLPSDDEQAELYESACSLLQSRGFVHYEISNFALPGYECVHNLNYWRGGEYLGLGPAAASHLNGKRFKNKADLDAYLGNPTGQIEEVEELKGEEKAAEEAILRLRLLQEGLDMDEMAQKYGDENILGLAGRLNNLIKKGTLLRNGPVYRIAESCALVSNPILADVLGE